MLPRGIRNNNPLNIRRSKDQWQGMKKEQTDSAFCQFENLAYGWRAAFKLLTRTYYHKVGATQREQHEGVCGERQQVDGHRSRRAARHPIREPSPLDSCRCSDGHSGERHHVDRLVRHAERVGDGKAGVVKKLKSAA